MQSSSPAIAKFAVTLEPPYETKGNVRPVRGKRRITPPTITNTWKATAVARPAASSFEKPSSAVVAIRKPRQAKSRYSSTTAIAPTRPISLAITE